MNITRQNKFRAGQVVQFEHPLMDKYGNIMDTTSDIGNVIGYNPAEHLVMIKDVFRDIHTVPEDKCKVQ